MIAVDIASLLPAHAAFEAAFKSKNDSLANLRSFIDGDSTDDYEDAVLTFIDSWAATRGWKPAGSCFSGPSTHRCFTPDQLRRGWGKTLCADQDWYAKEPDLIDYFIEAGSLRPVAVVVHSDDLTPYPAFAEQHGLHFVALSNSWYCVREYRAGLITRS